MALTALAAAVLIQTIAFTSVAQGMSSQIDESRRVVIRSAEEFQALWKAHSSAAIPKIDFSQSMVVGVFLGTRPSAGYSVVIRSIRRGEKGVVVEYVEGQPDKNQMVAQMLTSPFHLVAIPRDVGAAVEFRQLPR